MPSTRKIPLYVHASDHSITVCVQYFVLFWTPTYPYGMGNFFTLNMVKNRYFLITYPPHLVHVAFKRPPLSICVSNSQEPLAKDRNYVNDYLSALNCHKICQKSKKMIHIWRLARSTLHKKNWLLPEPRSRSSPPSYLGMK